MPEYVGAPDRPAVFADIASSPNRGDTALAAILLAVAPQQLKGAILYCDSRAAGEQWVERYHAMLQSSAPTKRVPGNISDERLLGGLDFSATFARGEAVSERGILAEADGGCVVLSAATAQRSTYTHIGRTLDCLGVAVEREGLSAVHATTFAAIVIQTVDDELVPASLADRLAFHVPLDAQSSRSNGAHETPQTIAAAHSRLASVQCSDAALVALTHAGLHLGIDSPRAVLLALHAARAHAALHGRELVADEDLAVATRLVLSPRSIRIEHESSPTTSDEELPANSANTPEDRDSVSAGSDVHMPEPVDATDEAKDSQERLTEILVRTGATALPAGLLTTFAARSLATRGSTGRSGTEGLKGVRGRQVGVRRGDPRGGARLDLVATLRAAIPMQRIRRQTRTEVSARRVELRRDDFRIRHCITPATTTALFVVDASGSSAMQRLAEAKGAVELMLAEGYARRDRVALITFRGTSAELVLPPTHALARARRAISGLPAGGGTPLATALDLATTVLQQLQRRGGQFVAIVLTDGRANVARDGAGGRVRAMNEALEAAERLGATCGNVLWVDTSPRPESSARELARRACARYLPLPSAGAHDLTRAVRNAGTATIE